MLAFVDQTAHQVEHLTYGGSFAPGGVLANLKEEAISLAAQQFLEAAEPKGTRCLLTRDRRFEAGSCFAERNALPSHQLSAGLPPFRFCGWLRHLWLLDTR